MRNTNQKSGQYFRNLSIFKKCVIATLVVTALTFTAAYAFNVSAEEFIQGLFDDETFEQNTKQEGRGAQNTNQSRIRPQKDDKGDDPPTAKSNEPTIFKPRPELQREFVDPEPEVDKARPGYRVRSEEIYGPFIYSNFLERIKNGEFPSQSSEIPSSVPFDSLSNNNNGSTGTSQFTQSETSVIAFGSTVLIGFNDSGSNAGGTNKFTGYSRSTDGGATFTDGGTLPTNAGGDAGDPVLARNETTGRIYFTTLGFSVPTIQVFRSDDNGATWMLPTNGTPGGASEDKQWVAVDNFPGAGNGNVYLISRNFGAGNGIKMYRSTDHGNTFGPSGGVPIVTGMQGAYVAVGPDHSVYAFWFSGTTLQVRKSTDFGVTFGAPVTVAAGLVGGVNGDLGLTGIRQGTATASGFRSNAFPHAAINPANGDIYVTYNNDGPGVDKGDVLLVQSTDGGATWSAPVKINDDVTTTDQWQPTITMAPDGSSLGIFYYSRQEDAGNNAFKYYGRTGAISGSMITFLPGFAVSDVPSLPEFGRDSLVNSVYMGDYNTAFATAGAFHAVWSDNRDDLAGGAGRKDPQVYYDKIPLGLSVTFTSPLVNSIVSTVPTSYVVNFTDSVQAATVDATDFTVDGIPADSFVINTPTQITFSYNVAPFAAEGVHTMAMAAASVLRDPDGNPLNAFSGNFRYDTLTLQVVSTVPPFPGGVFTLPAPFTYDVNFNEPIDPSSVQSSDLTLSGIAGSSVTGATVLPGNTTARFTLSVPIEGTLTASIAAGAVTDAFGNPGAAFTANYGVDIGTVPYPAPLAAKVPLGSMVYDPTASGTINFAGDTDNFTLNIDPNQTISLIVTPTSAGLRPRIELFDPANVSLGFAVATAPGDVTGIQTRATTTGGTYTFEVSSVGGTTGGYTLAVILNAAFELEGLIPGSNNTIASAQNIDASFITLQTSQASAQRGAVLGTTDNANYSGAAVPFTFEDISATGTVVPGLTGVDDVSISIPVGFTFPFYGASNTTVFVSSNGLMTFGTANTTFTNSDLTAVPPQAAIAPFWDDQHTAGGVAGSNVFFQVTGAGANQHLTVQWNAVRFFSGGTAGDTITYQAQLFADGRIQLNYLDLTSGSAAGNNGASSTVGIKDAGTQGSNRLLLAFNNGPNAFVGTGQSTLISPPNPTPDFYSFTANAGDVITLGAEVQGVGTANVELRDGANAVLASGIAATNLDSVINNFVIGAGGTYYARVSSPNSALQYNLVVTRNAAFDTEDNNTAATAQPIDGNRGALGGIAPQMSYLAAAVPFAFEDISGTGTVIAGLNGTDDTSVSIPIGFSFPFYGTSNANVSVSSNGLLTFGGTDASFTNSDLTNTPSLAAISPFWDDQFVTGSPTSSVLYEVLGSGSNAHLTIQWNQVSFFSGGTAGDTLTYQAQLFADGRIQLNYLDLVSGAAGGNNGTSASVGIKAAGVQGPNRLLLAFNNGPNAFVGTGQSTLISQPAGDDWYSLTLGAGNGGSDLETSTPSDGPGEFVNVLDPHIELYDSTGTTLIASGVTLGDGRNESLSATGLISGGSYRVKVTSQSDTTGEYFFTVVQTAQAVPPTISKSFGAASIQFGGQTTLYFTINNPNASTALTGIGFTDNFPAGLAVYASPGVNNTCGGTVSANAAATVFGLSDVSIAAGGSCTISVNVVGTSLGVKNNTTGNISANESGPGGTSNTATVTVVQAATTSAVTVSPNPVQYSDKVTLMATLSPASVLGVAPATEVNFTVSTGGGTQTLGGGALDG